MPAATAAIATMRGSARGLPLSRAVTALAMIGVFSESASTTSGPAVCSICGVFPANAGRDVRKSKTAGLHAGGLTNFAFAVSGLDLRRDLLQAHDPRHLADLVLLVGA